MVKKQPLQNVTNYKVMNIKECFNALGWSFTESEDRYNDIACSCGGEMDFSGFFGTEVIECKKCGKRMVDLFSPIQTGNSSATVLDPKNFDYPDGCHWIAIDGNGGVMEAKNA